MSNLKEIKIPDSVTKIEGSAFYECKKLQNVTLSKKFGEPWKQYFREL